jgi:hypothetical protein
MDRIEKLEEQNRSAFSLPAATPEDDKPEPDRGQWMNAVLRLMTGERLPDIETRQLADVITTDNIGIVPPTYSQELIGVINARRPFMESTRRLPTPSTGTKLIMPVIVQRPTVAEQETEKTELSSQATQITTSDFDLVTKGGAGDLSLQILKRSSPEFLNLYLELLGEAYAVESEVEAVAALIAEIYDAAEGLDPEDLSLGDAYSTAFTAIQRGPDTIWLSSSAVGRFIDAKANGTNAPLYSQLTANFTAAGGVGGSISGLRAVHVPALNASGVDVVVGPSNGFAWAEDGTYTLQVDVPAKAGRDVALVGMLWFAPLYPTAFKTYTLTS